MKRETKTDGPVFFAFVLNLLLVLLPCLLGEGVSTWLSCSHLCERSPRGSCREIFPLSAGMDGLAPQHSRVRLSVTMTGGLSENDDGEAGRLVKWLVIRYLLATWHKRTRALGILNEPVSLDQIARVPPEPRCVVLEGIPQRQLVPEVHQCRKPGAGWVTPALGLKTHPDLKSSFP